MKQKHALLIGVTVVIAILLVVLAILFLNPTPGDGKRLLRVRFQNIENISTGTRVTFAGKPVGSVQKILILPEDNAKGLVPDHLGIYPYELLLRVDSSVHVYPQDDILIHTSGLMGEKSISIIPVPPKGSPLPVVTEDMVLFSKDKSSLEDTMASFSEVLRKTDLTIDKVLNTIEQNQANVAASTASLTQVSAQLHTFMNTITTEHVADKLATLVTTATVCLDTYTQLANKALHGEGSLSKLLENDILVANLETTIHKTNMLLDSVLEYGLFFHTNANYKRSFLQGQNEALTNIQTIVDNARKTLLKAKSNLLHTTDPNVHEALIEYINDALLSLSPTLEGTITPEGKRTP